MAPPLAPGYYLDNFQFVLDHVEARYGDLLDPAERAFLDDFSRLSIDARRLYVRLSARKGPVFRDDKLCYPEIDNLGDAIDEAVAAGFLDEADEADAAALLSLVVKPELSAWWQADARLPRPGLIEAIASTESAAEIRARLPFRVLGRRRLEVLDVFRLLFFGNGDQDFTEFVLNDLGITPFEPVSIDDGYRLFGDRDTVEQARQLYAVRAIAFEVMGELDGPGLMALAQAVPPIAVPELDRRAGRLRARIARQLERLGHEREALELFGQTIEPPSRERQARLLAKQGNLTAALLICADIAGHPVDEEEFDFATRFASRLSPKAGVCLPGMPAAVSRRPAVCPLDLPKPEGGRVEEHVRAHFEQAGEEAWYVENALFSGLFGLAFWDVIFAPEPGMFLHPFQRGPLDLYSPEFRRRRHELIEQRFTEIGDEGGLRRQVEAAWQSRYGRANAFVYWGRLSESLIDRALSRMPVRHVHAVFRRLLRDLKSNRSGFPDLVVFPPDGGYRLVEVKGPGDTLQRNQRRWLGFFETEGLPAEVVTVAWT